MKSLALALFISLGVQASEYNCRFGMVKLELKTDGDMTSLLVKDAQTGQYYYDGIVSEINQSADLTEYKFETRSDTFLELQFKRSEIEQESNNLFGFARGWYGAGRVDTSIQCMKKI